LDGAFGKTASAHIKAGAVLFSLKYGNCNAYGIIFYPKGYNIAVYDYFFPAVLYYFSISPKQ